MSDRSNAVNAWVNKNIMPIAAKIGAFKPLIAIRDGIAMAMPLIIVGSLFMVINGFPITAWTNFLTKTAVHGVSLSQILVKVSNGSFGIMGLIAAFELHGAMLINIKRMAFLLGLSQRQFSLL